MRVTLTRLALIAAAAAAAACKDDPKDVLAPPDGAVTLPKTATAGRGPVVRITSPTSGEVVAAGEGRVGAGSLTDGSSFAITVETVTDGAADVPALEGINIRNTALLGQANPNFPGLTVLVDADLITPDGGIIRRNTNLANLFNILGSDDTPGDGVTIWAGWHFLESFAEGVNSFTITASVRDAAGRVATDVVKVKVDRKQRSAGQALTPAPALVAGDGVDDAGGPEVTLVGPREPSSLALGTPTAGSLIFFQVSALDRTGAGIGVNENGAGISETVGLIRDGSQIPLAGPNRNFPGLDFTVDVPLRQPNGNVVPAGQNLAPLFDLAGSALDKRASGRVRTTADWVVGGSLVVPEGKTSVTVTARVTDSAGNTGSTTRSFAISPVSEGQALTPAP